MNANGALYGALELSADYLPVLDPMTSKISQVPLSVLDPSTKSASGEVAQRSPYWGDKPYGTAKPMFTILCSTKKGVYGSQQQFDHQTILTSARKVLIIHQQKLFLLINHIGTSVCMIPRQGNTLP